MSRERSGQIHVDTLSTQSESAADRTRLRYPCLTLAYHPDWSRIGERAFIGHLVAQPVDVSRTEPAFVRRGDNIKRALNEPYVSRDALTLKWRGAEGVEVLVPEGYKKLVIDGEPVTSNWHGSAEAIARGIVFELGRRVVLVLHMATKREAPPALGMVGDSDAVDEIRIAILRVADLPVSVLIRGETGAGKEHVARAIHEAGPRKSKPWVAVNMAAVPPTTAASELFGHGKGAFTGADSARDGLFVRADGGTLFLDEVGETPDSIQPMLLRTLETGEVQPIGDKRARTVDTRIISATDADLDADQEAHRFRPALFHRLAGYQISVPPLRTHREDIGPLLAHFFQEELEQTGELDVIDNQPGRKPWLPTDVASSLIRFDWPGNVRQLRNVVRQIVISSRGEPHARLDHTLLELFGGASSRVAGPDDEPDAPAGDTAARSTNEISEERLLEALKANAWAIRPTAEALGIPRSSLYDLMRKSSSIRAASDIEDDEIREAHARCSGDVTAMANDLRVSERGLTLRMRGLDLGD
jgi:two-component system nitrogen regulation response regulator GlnG